MEAGGEAVSNFRVAVSGVPGTGKTTLSLLISRSGYRIIDLNVEAGKAGCLHEDEVDIGCLRERIRTDGPVIMDGHYSHLLDPYCVIITECSPDLLETRLHERGYDRAKIMVNLDVLLTDAIYDEASEYVPRNRIMRISTENGIKEKDFSLIMDFIKRMERKSDGT
jgi:adenylate kinase